MSKIWITSKNEKKIFNGGYLGSRDDEERSEMRYAMRIAKPRVIRSLNASGGGVKTFMFVSVWKGITHLNAIEVAVKQQLPSLNVMGGRAIAARTK